MGKGPLTPVLNSLLEELKTGTKQKRSALEDAWAQIIGPSMAEHTKGRLLKDGTLCVWVDDSVLAYELGRKHSGTLLQKTNEKLGASVVTKVIFRVGQIW
jgi:predicted nucleic acid-binding Zn ribbon protein